MRVRTLWRVVLPLYILILALTVGWSATHRHSDLRVTFLDVGQGDSCVVEVTICGAISVKYLSPYHPDKCLALLYRMNLGAGSSGP